MSKSITRTETFKNTVTKKTKDKNFSETHVLSTSVLRTGPRSLSADNVIRIVVLVLLFLSVFSILFGHHTIFGVQTLLNTISDLESLSNFSSDTVATFLTLVHIPEILGDWGIFDGLRGFLNTTTGILNSIVSFVCFMGEGFYQLHQFVLLIFSNL